MVLRCLRAAQHCIAAPPRSRYTRPLSLTDSLLHTLAHAPPARPQVKHHNSKTAIPDFPIAPEMALELLTAANYLDC